MLIVALGIPGWFSCRPVVTDRPPVEAMVVVELDAFSGPPNPRWELTGDQAAELRRLVAELPVTSGSNTPDGLGYRGFVLRPKDSAAAEDFDEIRVYRGTVAVSGRKDFPEVFSDRDHRVERWLFEAARGHVPSALLQAFSGENHQ